MTRDSKCRFIEEYANFQKACIKTEYRLSAKERNDMARIVDNAVWNARRGYITVDECMNTISRVRRGW